MTTEFINKPWAQSLLWDDGRDLTTRRRTISTFLQLLILACLVLLAFGLPISKITSSRDWGILGGFGFWLIYMGVTGKWSWTRTALDLPLALFFAAGLVSLATAIDPGYTLHELRGEMLKGIMTYYLAVNTVRTEKRGRVLGWALVAGIFFMDAYGLVHFLIDSGSFLTATVRENSLHRGCQEFSTYLVQTAPFLIIGWMWSDRRRLKIVLGALFILHVVAVYITFSRMAILALALEVTLFLIIIGIPWKAVAAGGIAVLVALSIVMPRPVFLLDNDKVSGLDVGRVTITGLKGSRIELWKKALGYVAESPFAGFGFGRQAYSIYFPELKKKHKNLWHAHNTLINLTLEMGVQGLVFFLFILYRILRSLWPGADRSPPWLKGGVAPAFTASVWVMTIGYFFRNMTDDIYNNDAALLFWLLVGAAFSFKIFLGTDRKNSPDSD